MSNWYITLGGQHCSSLQPLARSLASYPFADELPLWKRAHSFEFSRGTEPGVGYTVLKRGFLDGLDRNAYHEFTWRNQFETVTIKRVVIVRALSMFGLPDDDKSPMLVEVRDCREIMRRSVVARQYNVVIPAPPASNTENRYYPESLSGFSTVWTWQGIVGDLWEKLTDGSAAAVNLTLPASSYGVPENLRFLGVNAWEAVHQVLKRIGCTTAYDPLTDAFSIVRLGNTQDGLGQALDRARSRLRQDFDPPDDFNAGNMPATVSVFFPRRDRWQGIELDTPRNNNWEMYCVSQIDAPTNVSGARGSLAVQGDMWALSNRSSPTAVENYSDLQFRATQIAQDVAQNYARRLRQVYVGAVSGITLGSEISRIEFRDYQDGIGQITTVEHTRPIPFLDDTDGNGERIEGESFQPLDLGRKSHPIYPDLLQVVEIYHPAESPSQAVTSCDHVLPISGTLSGSALSIMIHPGRVRLLRNGLEVLEPCWITALDCYDQLQGNVGLFNHAVYHGRLSGTAVASAGEYPLYTIRTGTPLALAMALDCIEPGKSGRAVVMRWDAEKEDWAQSDIPITIADPGGWNFLTPVDPPVFVTFNCCSNRHDIIGSHGLLRKGICVQDIECGAAGKVEIIYQEGSEEEDEANLCPEVRLTPPCEVTAQNCFTFDKCSLDAVFFGPRKFLKGEQVYVHYLPFYFFGDSKEEVVRGTWQIMPFYHPRWAAGELIDDMCVDHPFGEVALAPGEEKYLDGCGLVCPGPTFAQNTYKLAGETGAKVLLLRTEPSDDKDTTNWRIVQVEHVEIEIIDDLRYDDCKIEAQKGTIVAMQCDPKRTWETKIQLYQQAITVGLAFTDTASGSGSGYAGTCKLEETRKTFCVFDQPSPDIYTTINFEPHVVTRTIRQNGLCIEANIITIYVPCSADPQWVQVICGEECPSGSG